MGVFMWFGLGWVGLFNKAPTESFGLETPGLGWSWDSGGCLPPSRSEEKMAAPAAQAHVVCRVVCTFEDEDSQVRLDEAARRLILIRHREFVALPLGSLGQAPSAAADAGTIRCDNGGKVENLRFSLTHRFVAVQRSDTTLELVDLTQGNTFTHVCRGGGSKARWRILGFQWTGTPVSDLLVVTSAGVEFYLVLPERCALKLVKTVQHAVSWCVYSHETLALAPALALATALALAPSLSLTLALIRCVYSHETRLLLLATGPQDTLIHGIQVQPTAIVRIPKFEVQLALIRTLSPTLTLTLFLSLTLTLTLALTRCS